MYLLHILIALSILTVCTGLDSSQPKYNYREEGEQDLHLTNFPIRKSRSVDPRLWELYQNHKDGDGLLATWGDAKKKGRAGIDPELAKLYENHKAGDGLLMAPPVKKRGAKKRGAIAGRKTDGLIIIHNEKKRKGVGGGLDPGLAKLYKNHKKGDGLLAIYDGKLGSHIDPILKKMYKNHKKGDGLLAVYTHGSKVSYVDPDLIKMYKEHKGHDKLLVNPNNKKHGGHKHKGGKKHRKHKGHKPHDSDE